MDMQIVIRNVEDGSELRSYADEHLARVLERFEDHVVSATMRLEDVTGPEKGGIDKQCSIEVRLRSGEVRIKEIGDEFFATINIALDRLKAAVSREASKAKRGVGEG